MTRHLVKAQLSVEAESPEQALATAEETSKLLETCGSGWLIIDAAAEPEPDGFATSGVSPGSRDGVLAKTAAPEEIEQIFEIDALVIVPAIDEDSAYGAAGELVRLAEDTDGRVHLALLDNCERGGS